MKQQKTKKKKQISATETVENTKSSKHFPLIQPFVFDDKQEAQAQLKKKSSTTNYAWLDYRDPVKKNIQEVSSQRENSFDASFETNLTKKQSHRCEVYSLKSYNPQNVSKLYRENLTKKAETLIQVPRISRVLLQRSRRGGF